MLVQLLFEYDALLMLLRLQLVDFSGFLTKLLMLKAMTAQLTKHLRRNDDILSINGKLDSLLTKKLTKQLTKLFN